MSDFLREHQINWILFAIFIAHSHITAGQARGQSKLDYSKMVTCKCSHTVPRYHALRCSVLISLC